jgi:glutamyl-tRNA synthetase
MTAETRVRMAPGPTGPFHIGRTRTALINWLYARHTGGKFVLRIEDTDVKRSRPEHLQTIFDALRWLGLDWDEGPEIGGPFAPYFQMGRLESYRDYADRLLQDGHAYKCYCTPEELDALRKQADREKRPFTYPGTCRNLAPEEQARREAQGIEPVLRLQVPDEGKTEWEDLILGPVSYENAVLGDFVIMRASGVPLYNFAVAIDDLTMEITDVIRGQDHVSNTPRQIQVYNAIGAEMPRFGHVPLVVGIDRSKIGARFGAEPLTSLANAGYLPEALFNYFATLGTTYEADREIYSRDEIVHLFDISKVGKAAVAFDEDKLEWMNGVYIRSLPVEEFVERSLPFLQIRGLVSSSLSAEEREYVTAALALEQERVKTLADTVDAVDFFFQDELTYDPLLLIPKKGTHGDALRVLEASLREVQSAEDWNAETLEERFRQLTDSLELKTGITFMTIRVAITGRTFAPPLFATMVVLGRERVRERLERAWGALEAATASVSG